MPFQCELKDCITKGFIVLKFGNFLDDNMKSTLLTSSHKLLNCHRNTKPHSNKRGQAIQLHFGFWGKHSHHRMFYQTKDTRDPIAPWFIAVNNRLWTMIELAISTHLPEYYQYLQNRKSECKTAFTIGVWHTMAYNRGLQAARHVDSCDDPRAICIVIPLGDWTGGNFRLNEYNLELSSKFGDFIALDSANRVHEVMNVRTGWRDSIVLFNSKDMRYRK